MRSSSKVKNCSTCALFCASKFLSRNCVKRSDLANYLLPSLFCCLTPQLNALPRTRSRRSGNESFSSKHLPNLLRHRYFTSVLHSHSAATSRVQPVSVTHESRPSPLSRNINIVVVIGRTTRLPCTRGKIKEISNVYNQSNHAIQANPRLIRFQNHHRLPSLLRRNRPPSSTTPKTLRFPRLQTRPHDMDQTKLVLDDVPIRLRHQRQAPGAHPRPPDDPCQF